MEVRWHSRQRTVQRLDQVAQQVGKQIGWAAEFLRRSEPRVRRRDCRTRPRLLCWDPLKLSDLAAHDIELELDSLERGDRQIRPDEDGDPRLHLRAAAPT